MTYLKKLLFILIATLLWISPVNALKDKEIRVIVNNKAITFEVPPVQVNGRVFVPIRAIMDQLGAEVKYDNSTHKINISLNDLNISMELNSRFVSINSTKGYMDAAPQLINSRIMVPLRFIADYLGYEITWNSVDRIVSIQEKSKAYTMLNTIDLRQYLVSLEPVPLYTRYPIDYQRTWSEPFSFSGQFDLHIDEEGDVSEVKGGRTGKYIGNSFAYLTQATANNFGEISNVRNEVIQDLVNFTTYRNQGAGWSRYKFLDEYELDGTIGSRQLLLDFLLLNHKQVELQNQVVEGNNKLVFKISTSKATDLDIEPLTRILESFHDDNLLRSYSHNDGNVNVTIIVDATNFRIDSTDVSFALGKSQPITYKAHYDYSYEKVTPIEDFIISNTGLELLNEAVHQDFNSNYTFRGDLIQSPNSIQAEGSMQKDSKLYVKLLIGKQVFKELYEEFGKDIRKIRLYNDQWKNDNGPHENLFYSGNKLNILQFINEQSSVPSMNTVTVDGKEKMTLEFQIEAPDWSSVEKLDRMLLGEYYTGRSFDVIGKAEFVFVIDIESKFIEAMTTTVSINDMGEKETYLLKYQYFADQLGEVPVIK